MNTRQARRFLNSQRFTPSQCYAVWIERAMVLALFCLILGGLAIGALPHAS